MREVDTWIPTATGGRVFFDPIDVSEVKIRDIALGLARQPRFAGQFGQEHGFYSVAEHCVWGSYVAPAGCRLRFLVHDAVEALIPDMTSPLKRLFPEFRVFEKELEAALFKKFGWPAILPNINEHKIKEIDLAMLAAEKEQLRFRRLPDWKILKGVTPANVKLERWLPSMAWVVWEDRYKELVGRGEH